MYRKGGERDPFQLNQVNILYGLLLFLKIAHVTWLSQEPHTAEEKGVNSIPSYPFCEFSIWSSVSRSRTISCCCIYIPVSKPSASPFFPPWLYREFSRCIKRDPDGDGKRERRRTPWPRGCWYHTCFVFKLFRNISRIWMRTKWNQINLN